jgi:hypothetical protein
MEIQGTRNFFFSNYIFKNKGKRSSLRCLMRLKRTGASALGEFSKRIYWASAITWTALIIISHY